MEMKIGVAGGSTKTKYVKRFIVRPMIEGSCKFLNNSIEVSLTPFSVEEMTVCIGHALVKVCLEIF